MDEYDDGIDYVTFDACKGGHPDDHWQLDPICHLPTMVGPHWADRNDPPICGEPASSYVHRPVEGESFHEPVPMIGPVIWGHGAWRRNPCPGYVDSEYTDGQWQRLERARKCSCLCHRGTHYVNVYELEQGYGGPEEGGWYYEAGEPVASVPFDTLREAEAERDRLVVRFPPGKNRYSVAPRGTDYGVYIEGHFAAPFPQHTPRYS
jgi:hypothetical protein